MLNPPLLDKQSDPMSVPTPAPVSANASVQTSINESAVTSHTSSASMPTASSAAPTIRLSTSTSAASSTTSTVLCAATHDDLSVPSPVITQTDISSEFPSVFDGNVKVMEGEEFHITLADGAQPFCVRTPRTIPFAYREKLKAELDLLLSQGIIAPVTEPTVVIDHHLLISTIALTRLLTPVYNVSRRG